MSLIAWWPLNDDTNNYGTLGAEIQATASNATFADGKIGQALYKGSLTLTGEQWKKIIGNTISIAMWIYTRNDGSYSAGTPFFGMGGMTAPNNRKFSMFHYNTKTNLHCSWQNDDSNSTYWSCHYSDFFELNKWVHLCVVQDAATNTVTVYRNGEQYSKSTVNGLSSMNFKEAGTAPVRANIDYQHMNDLRIYDHALSQVEVKELSKALVCHYRLDGGNHTNLLLNTFSSKFDGFLSRSSGTIVFDDILQKNVYECSNTATGEKFVFYSNRFAVIGGKPYTFSCDVYCNDKLKGLDVYLLTSSTLAVSSTSTSFDSSGGVKYFPRNFSSAEKLVAGQWVHITGTLTPDSNQISGYIRIDNNGSTTSGTAAILRVANFKLEQGTKATVVGSHPSESLFNTMEPDCSGNGNDAIKYGTLTYSSDSIMNGSCTVFPGTAGNYINCGSGGKVRDAITVNWWGYMDNWSSYGRAISCTEGGGWNFEPVISPSGTPARMNFACGTGTTSNTYKSVGSATTLASLAAGWHMFTGTYDGKTTKIYIDGKLEGTNNAYSSHIPLYYANNSIFLGIEAQGGTNNPTSPYFNGRISDVRIYGTALKIEDIQELYNTRGYVSDQGDMLSGEWIEDASDIQITSQGIGRSLVVQELGNSEYTPIEYIASTGSQYIDTGYYWTTEKATIVADLMVTKWQASSTIFGSEERYSGSSRYFAHILHAGAANGSYSNYIGTGSVATTTLSLSTRSLIEYIAHGNNKMTTRVTANGTTTTSANNVGYAGTIKTRQNSTHSAANRGNIYIFSNHNAYNGTDGIQKMGAMRLYRFTMYDNGVCVRDFIPCKRKKDNAIGLFDNVTGEFYLSPNNVAFTAGPDSVLDTTAKFVNGKTIQARNIIEI